MISVIIVAGGSSTRIGRDKLIMPAFPYKNTTVLECSIRAFVPFADEIIVVSNNFNSINHIIENIRADYSHIKVVNGGSTRALSVKSGLGALSPDSDFTLIHDGARPYLSSKLVQNVIADTLRYDVAIPAISSSNAIYFIDQSSYLDRDKVMNVMTPQGFATKKILEVYDKLEVSDYVDEGSAYLAYFHDLHITEGEATNIKITYPEDIAPAYRIGGGYDTHELVADRPLILGGVNVPHSKGLLGHSDADVVAHALMDSILNACGERDIGYHFPDTDPAYKGISSILLLDKVIELIQSKGYHIHNVSITILLEKPKLKDYIPAIQATLSEHLGIPIDRIGIGVTTTEKLGFVGREEGIACYANTLVYKS